MPTFAKESAVLFVPGAEEPEYVLLPSDVVVVGAEPGAVCRMEVTGAVVTVAVAVPSRSKPLVVGVGWSALRCWRLEVSRLRSRDRRLLGKPANVMRASSAVQDVFEEAKMERRVEALSGMLNEDASSSNGGISKPTVALLWPGTTVLLQPTSAALRQRGPVKPLAQMHPQVFPAWTVTVPPFSQGLLVLQSSSELFVLLELWCRRGRTMSTTGTIMAAATRMTTSNISMMKPHKGMPQHLRPRFRLFRPSYPRRELLRFRDEGTVVHWWWSGVVGVAWAGFGKEARMPVKEPSDLLFIPPPSFSSFVASLLLSANIHSTPSLLAVFPRSRLAARRVALRIKSGRLVRLPLASDSRIVSTLSFGGRLWPIRSVNEGLGVKLDAVVSIAPPFSKPPRIWSTRGSIRGEPAIFRVLAD